jgi:hypothetical protein
MLAVQSDVRVGFGLDTVHYTAFLTFEPSEAPAPRAAPNIPRGNTNILRPLRHFLIYLAPD